MRSKEAYRHWRAGIANLNRIDRYTLGARIDDVFLSLLEFIYQGCFAHDKFEKLSLVSYATAKNDLLRFFLQIGWEENIIDQPRYAALIILLDDVGRMLGGWKKSLS